MGNDLGEHRARGAAFARDHVAGSTAARDRDGRWDPALFAALGEAGLLGAALPAAHGGGGLGDTALGALADGFGAGGADPGAALAWLMHAAVCAAAIAELGTAAQRARYLPSLARGAAIAAYAHDEGIGTGPGDLATVAVREGDRWRLYGTKRAVINAPIAHLLVVTARTAAGPTAFVIEREAPGAVVGAPLATPGLRTAATADVELAGCAAGDDAVLGAVGGAAAGVCRLARIALHVHGPAPWLGCLEHLLERAVERVRTGAAFGRPRVGSGAARRRLAELRLQLELARRTVERAASLREQRAPDHAIEAASAALFAGRAVAAGVRLALELDAPVTAGADDVVHRLHRDLAARPLAGDPEELLQTALGAALAGIAGTGAGAPAGSAGASAGIGATGDSGTGGAVTGAAPPAAEPDGFAARFARVCAERVAPHAAAADRAGALVPEAWRAVVDAGYLGVFHPRALGGLDADGATQARAMEALGAACASTLWVATISSALCGKILHHLCRPVHHERWLRPIISGERIGCFAASESGSGCDPGSYATVVRDERGAVRLTGEKQRISNAGLADVAVVLARAGAAIGPLCYVVVDLRRPGVIRADEPRVGLRAMPWGTLRFDGVEVDAEDIITDADMDRTLQAVEWGQLLQSTCAIGIAAAALDAATTYARERHAFGRPIGHLDAVHARLADARAELDAARAITREAAAIKAQGRAARELVMMAKIHATEMAVRGCDRAMQTFGGWGFAARYPIERLYRDSLANVPAGLTTDRLRELLACPMTGADPWRYPPLDWLGPAGLALG